MRFHCGIGGSTRSVVCRGTDFSPKSMRLFRPSLLTALLAMGCSDSNAPGLPGTVYVLQSIDGQPLPAPYAENLQLPDRMFADTLVLRDDGTGESRIVIEESLGGLKDHQVQQLTYSGTTHIEITFICPPAALCIAGPHLAGDASAGGIVFSVSKVTRAPLVFERAAP